MARTKSSTPVQRTPLEIHAQNGNAGRMRRRRQSVTERIEHQLEEVAEAAARDPKEQKQAGLLALAICVGGIYGAFLSWAYFQEKITTTTYGPHSARFTYSIVLNTIQSTLAFLTGYIYLLVSAPKTGAGRRRAPPIFPSTQILPLLVTIALTTSLASPFGYASLAHIDYITFILAKSCKLLPVMFLHVTLFRKRYPAYKYLVVLVVTLGVSVFTLYNPSTSKKSAKHAEKNSAAANKLFGLALLGVNLLFDGLTNTIQDQIFTRFKGFTGPQMMCAQNAICTLLTSAYLLLTPYLAAIPLVAPLLPPGAAAELGDALAFMKAYPRVGIDVLVFAMCGAVGQVFIFHTLAHFSSLLLVTVTVTRKMLTMLMSVVVYGHRVTRMQWLGVGLVFGGIGAEAWYQRVEKKAKMEAKKREAGSGKAQ